VYVLGGPTPRNIPEIRTGAADTCKTWLRVMTESRKERKEKEEKKRIGI
jgi:hypothetical protein